MNSDKIRKFEDAVSVSRVFVSYEITIKAWHDRLKAVQKLRRQYRDSPFVQETLKKEEKSFKAKWWKSLNEYKQFKKEMGMA